MADRKGGDEKDELPSSPTTTKGKRCIVVDLISGGVAGLCVDAVLFPIDTVKTRMQSVGSDGSLVRASLYRGLLPCMIASVPSAASFFATYESVKSALDRPGVPEPLAHVLAACMGNVVQTLVRNPFELVKQRMQAGVGSPTPLGAVKEILCRGGPFRLWTGACAMMARDMPFDAIQYPLYEATKKRMGARMRKQKQLSDREKAFCGFLAGGLTAALTTPLDVLKTRRMTAAKISSSSSTTAALLSSIIRKEGVAALFLGALPRVCMISLGGAIYFGAYESTRTFVVQQRRMNEEKQTHRGSMG